MHHPSLTGLQDATRKGTASTGYGLGIRKQQEGLRASSLRASETRKGARTLTACRPRNWIWGGSELGEARVGMGTGEEVRAATARLLLPTTPGAGEEAEGRPAGRHDAATVSWGLGR